MSKYFVPVEIDGKWWVVENAPEERDFIDDGQDFYILRYYAALESCTKYPTLESDSAYWKSKEGMKMGEGEFNLELVKSKVVDYLEYTAIPLQSPTTKELIEQEADRYANRIINMLDDLARDVDQYEFGLPVMTDSERMVALVKSTLTTFALSLPKQDTSLYKKQPMYKVILQNDTYTYVLIEQMLTPDEYPYCQKYELYRKGFVPKCFHTLEADKDYWASNIERSLQDGEFYINENGCAMPPKQDNGDAWDEAKKMALEEFDDWGIKYGRISRLIAFLKQHYSISKIK